MGKESLEEIKGEEKPFDPERDISNQDWTKIKEELEKDRNDNDISYRAMIVKILDPEQNFNLSDENRQEMKRDLEKYREKAVNRDDYWSWFSLQAMKIKILDPKQDLNLGDKEWQGMKNELEKSLEIEDWRSFSDQAMEMKILDPKQDLNLTNKNRQGMKSELEKYRKDGEWKDFSLQAMRIKILDSEQDLNLGDKEWQEMKKDLEEYREEGWGWGVFLEQAMAMKILAADRVEVDENGLKVK